MGAPLTQQVARLRSTAAALVERASGDPAGTLREAEALLAVSAGDDAAEALLHHAAGLALRDLARPREAATRLRQAVAAAERAGDDRRAALATTSLALAVAMSSEPGTALALLDDAQLRLQGADLGRTLLQRGVVLAWSGRLDEAEAAMDAAQPLLREAGDRLGEVRLLNGRGIQRAYRDDYDGALRDLQAAARLCATLDRPDDEAKVRHNLGFVAGRRGDLPTALAHLDAAEAHRRRLGSLTLPPTVDRVEVLLAARLDDEADDLATRLVAALERAGSAADLADARLLAAEVALVVGDHPRAQDLAEAARSTFDAQQRRSAALTSSLVGLRARVAGGAQLDRSARDAAVDLARELAASWPTAAQDAWLLAGEAALAAADADAARLALGRAAAGEARRGVGGRMRSARARALLARLDGDDPQVLDTVTDALDALSAHRATLAATDLRAHAARHAAELVSLGVQVAVAAHDAERVLDLVERWRAGARPRSVRPPRDPALVAELAELRAVSAAAADPTTSQDRRAALETRREDLERAVQRRVRRTSAPAAAASPAPARIGDGAASPRLAVAAVRSAALGSSERLVVHAQVGDRLIAVVGRDHLELVDLGPVAVVRAATRSIRFALARLADRRRPETAQAAARRAFDAAAAQLDETLAAPLGPTDAVRDLLVPTGALHALPWPALPTWRARPLRTAPSLSSLLGPTSDAPTGPPLLVAGPGLRYAEAEIDAVAARRPGSHISLRGQAATATAVRDHLEGAAWAHLATHGDFRADSPLFSSLRLADGRLVVHDLEAVRVPPAVVVLSACGAGRSATAGDALLGLATSLLALGVRSVVAPVLDVPDAETVQLVVDLHAGLEAGAAVADALAAARVQAFGRGSPRDLVAGSAMLCLGA